MLRVTLYTPRFLLLGFFFSCQARPSIGQGRDARAHCGSRNARGRNRDPAMRSKRIIPRAFPYRNRGFHLRRTRPALGIPRPLLHWYFLGRYFSPLVGVSSTELSVGSASDELSTPSIRGSSSGAGPVFLFFPLGVPDGPPFFFVGFSPDPLFFLFFFSRALRLPGFSSFFLFSPLPRLVVGSIAAGWLPPGISFEFTGVYPARIFIMMESRARSSAAQIARS